MKHKVGDEVLVKVQIVEDGVFGYGLKTPDGILFNAKRDSVIPVPDMTAEEAWEIAGKIYAEIHVDDIYDTFGTSEIKMIMKENTPQQAKAKIEAWEEEKDINVGDVISNPCFGKGVVFGIAGDRKYAMLTENGDYTYGWDRSALKKTGRHIDIDEILKQIGGDE